MDIPENQYKVSLKWLYHCHEGFLLAITLNEVVRKKKERNRISIIYVFTFFPLCVILFMVNLN